MLLLAYRHSSLLSSKHMKRSLQTNDLCLYYPLTIPSLRHSPLHNIRYGIEAVKKYLKGSGTNQIDIEEFDTPALASLIAESSIPTGKEVLLIKSFVDDFDYMIVELFRFDDDGSKRLEFFDNKCLLSDKTTVWTVLHRTATYVGMAKFLSENMTLLPGSRGFVDIPANGIEDVESTPHAQAYA